MDLTTGTFDTTNALSSMYLWLIFGYLASLLNCDLQRLLQTNVIALHLFSLVAFFFLFTILDTGNSTNVLHVWLKTIAVYALFLMMTKSKYYYAVPVLFLLLVDQTLKKHVQFEKNKPVVEQGRDFEGLQKHVSKFVNVATVVLIVAGMLHYMYLQKVEYGSAFSYMKFFFGVTKCKSKLPNYAKLTK
jgi:hypothetical protein